MGIRNHTGRSGSAHLGAAAAVVTATALLILAGCTASRPTQDPTATGSDATSAPVPDPKSLPVGPAIRSGTPIAYVAPDGSGSTCTQSKPCATLDTAYNAVPDKGVIAVAGGRYDSQKLRAADPSAPVSKRVVIQSAPGESAVLAQTTLSRRGVTLSHLAIAGILRIGSGRTVIDSVRMIGGAGNGSIIVRSSDVTIEDSLVSGGYAHDGINIAGYPERIHGIVVRRNVVRDIGGDRNGLSEHPDCIQIFDAYGITISQNKLYNCYNSGITFSPGARRGIDHVTVASNFIESCLSSRQRCGNGGSAMDLRVGASAGSTPVSEITVEHNTFGSGSLRLPYQPGVSAPDNIVHYLSVYDPCTTSLTDSLIGGDPDFACKNGTPGATEQTHSGNVTGTATFVDPDRGDLHVRKAVVVPGAKAASDSASSVRDIDGQPFGAGVVGADQPGH